MCGLDVVVEAAKFDGLRVHVVDDIGALRIIVARLADGADVDEIFFGRIHFELRVSAAAHDGVAHKGDGHVRVAEEAHLRVLIRKTGGGSELIENVTPAVGRVERGVNHGEIRGHAGVFQIAQPLFVVSGELVAGPVNGFSGVGIKAVERIVGGAVFVVVALDYGNIQVANDIEAFLGICVVANHVAEADGMRDVLGADVLQHHLKCFPVSVNVCNDGVFHFLTNNLKSPKFIFRVRPNYLFVADKSSKTCVMQRRMESLQFRLRPFRNQFDAAIGQIFY